MTLAEPVEPLLTRKATGPKSGTLLGAVADVVVLIVARLTKSAIIGGVDPR